MKTKFWQGGHCYSVETPINRDFLYHNLKFKEKEIMSLRVGSGLPNIQLKRLYSFQIAIPDQETQIQIADIFNSFNLEIKTLMKKLKKSKELKRSMMQNLLTGKIRLI
jgi:type I restriction enzyme S subunit